MSQTTQQASGPFNIGIDFHKHYSVFCVIDERNMVLDRGRIEHKIPVGFEHLLKRYPGCRAVFETTMNWHWLYEILEAHRDHKDIVLANACKIRILAEAQVKTDKVDAYMFAKFLKAELISTVHIPSKRTAREEFFCLVIFKGQEPGKHIVRLRAYGIDLISAEGKKTTTQILRILTHLLLVCFFRTAMFKPRKEPPIFHENLSTSHPLQLGSPPRFSPSGELYF